MKPLTLFLNITFAFLILFLKIYSTHCVSTASSTLPPQVLTLLSIKASLKDPLNTLHDWDPSGTGADPGFNKSVHPIWCNWSGIKCDNKTSQITTLDLSFKNLSGTIHSDIKDLSHLHYLNLSGNFLDGPLQPAIFELQLLIKLDISHNSFNSTFPPGISGLKSLTYLNAFSNSFSGSLPEDIIRLENLEFLNLGGSYFDGSIPASYGGFSILKFLYLNGNGLTGSVPPELFSLDQLQHLEIGYNDYTTELPGEIGNLSNLVYLDISSTNISGAIPVEIGNLKKLETLLLFKNHLVGNIPESISQLKSLKALDFSDNHLSGFIPSGFSSLKELTILSLMNNNLTGEIPEGIGQLPNLETLYLWNNSLTGILPQSLGSNAKLLALDVSSNYISGPIPQNLCLSNKLFKLILFSNKFIGGLPPSLANCATLSRFRVQNNNLNGTIPFGFGFLNNLTFMDISKNGFTGAFPKDIGNAPKLQFLNISENSLSAELPDDIWSSPSLQIFSASFAGLVGKIPDFKSCQILYKLELNGNHLTGNIPWDIDNCEKLICLSFRSNFLTGIIPWEISKLPSITDVDLSHNNLTGTIPLNFENCSTLESFNVSFNQLTGPVPSPDSIFSSFHPSSFTGNPGLCGGLIQKPCINDNLAIASGPVEDNRHPKKTAGAIVWIIAAAFGVGIFILIAGTRFFQGNFRGRFSGDQCEIGPWKLTAFQRLNFTEQDLLECLSMSNNILGMGSAGTVYKAEMPGGEIIAVKKLWGKNNKETINWQKRGVLAEVDVLGNVRHRNIVRLIGCCSNNECTMLLYEYMPNGSLDDLLHGKNKHENLVADWFTRYKIALGVAQGICYLHHDCDPVIVHRDLKPSNILLDSEMEARVADFGVAKLIQGEETMSVIAGSYGYIAPEYAYTLQVDEKSDIYSFGVVLMELLSGKRSVDAEFGDGNSIVDWVRSKMKIKNGVLEVLDTNAGASCALVREEMMLLLRIALLCTSRNPNDRPSMRDVVSMLQEAKPMRKIPVFVGQLGGVNGHRGDSIQVMQKPTVEC
ncbi:hypothetical protein LIER_21082 [Lithospermum erythrorhizon]|uniref:non-specific serine/threonine protein kinase n=1 Tax=Lithospermum erythrorhizon TaxID=34254 RepID=A0AAV3QUM1_LITER